MQTESDLFLEYVRSRKIYYLGNSANESEISKFETRFGLNLPFDVREYFSKINGLFCEGSSLSPTLYELNEWHRLIDNEFEKGRSDKWLDNADKFFVFGKWGFHWVIKLNETSDDPTPVYLLQDKAILVANSLSDFLQQCRASDFSVVHWQFVR